MGPDNAPRRSIIYCPRCGQQAGCVLIGDTQFVCKRCGYDFLVYIGPAEGLVKNGFKNSLNEKPKEEYASKKLNLNTKPTQ